MTGSLPPYPGPTKELSANYGAGGAPFAIADDGEDDLDERDLYRLARATEDHNHGVGRGLPVNRIGTTTTPQAPGDIGVQGDDFTWWGDDADQALTAVNAEIDQTVNGVKRFNDPLLLPRQIDAPAAPGIGLASLYLGPGDRLYLRAGLAQPSPVGTPTLLGAALTWQNSSTPVGFTPTTLQQLGTANGPVWAHTFLPAALNVCTLASVVPPHYGSTPITVFVEWTYTGTDATGKVNWTLLAKITHPGESLATGAWVEACTVTADATASLVYRREAILWETVLPTAGDLIQYGLVRRQGQGDGRGHRLPHLGLYAQRRPRLRLAV